MTTGSMRIVNVMNAICPVPSLIRNVDVKVPGADGVPVIRVGLSKKLRPGGSGPDTCVMVRGAVPPLGTNSCEKATPTLPCRLVRAGERQRRRRVV